MSLTYAFLPITKAEKRDDGTLSVVGKATGPDLDLDEQVCDPKWLAKAMPAWFESGANVREMHQPIAAGVGEVLEQDGDDWVLRSLVVDPGSVKKTEAKVLTGYSVGIRSPKIVKDAAAPGGRIVGGQIFEVSLVDRPANPTCKLSLSKAAGLDGDVLVDAEVAVGDQGSEMIEPPQAGQVKALSPDDLGGAVEEGPAEEVAEEAVEADLVAQARAALQGLLVMEAGEVPEGGSTGVVRILLNLLENLDWFESADAWDDEAQMAAAMKAALTAPTMAEEAPMDLTKMAGLVKAALADDAPDEDREAVDELRKALLPASDDVTTPEESTEVTALKGVITDLEARLAQVEKTAVASGPARTASPAPSPVDVAKAAAAEDARRFKALADQTTDPDLRSGYRRLAADAAARAA